MTREEVEQEEAVAMDAARRIAEDLRTQAHDEGAATIAEAVRPESGRPRRPEQPRAPRDPTVAAG